MIIYGGDHSMSISGLDTWEEFGLAPMAKPTFAPPKMKTKLVSIEGTSSRLDLSTVLTGYPTYENSEGTWSFLWNPEKGDWAEYYSKIMNYIHGRNHTIILNDDPEYYREGLLTVNTYDSKDHTVEIEIDYSVAPYKRKLQTVSELYPSVFTNITVKDGSTYLDIVPDFISYLDEEPVCPTITVNDNANIELEYYNRNFNQSVHRVLTVGTKQYPDIVFGTHGNNHVVLKAKGTGTMSIDFRQGRL